MVITDSYASFASGGCHPCAMMRTIFGSAPSRSFIRRAADAPVTAASIEQTPASSLV